MYKNFLHFKFKLNVSGFKRKKLKKMKCFALTKKFHTPSPLVCFDKKYQFLYGAEMFLSSVCKCEKIIHFQITQLHCAH